VSSNPPPIPRAPAAREKLAAALAVKADLECSVAALALEASEDKPGAAQALAAQRAKIDAAARQVAELTAAVDLAAFLDREAAVEALARMRASQLAAYTKAMQARTKAMTAVLEAAAAMAKSYGEYAEATQEAMTVVPSGTVVPIMGIGPNNCYGPAWGPAGLLIQSELWRLAPARVVGGEDIGRFVIPFAKAPSFISNRDTMPAALDEWRAADQAILEDVRRQLDALNERARATIAAAKTKEAA